MYIVCICDTGKGQTSPLNDELNYHKLACFLYNLTLSLFLFFAPPQKKILYYFFLRHNDVLRFLFEVMEDLLDVLIL